MLGPIKNNVDIIEMLIQSDCCKIVVIRFLCVFLFEYCGCNVFAIRFIHNDVVYVAYTGAT